MKHQYTMILTTLILFGIIAPICAQSGGPTYEETVQYIEEKFNECGEFRGKDSYYTSSVNFKGNLIEAKTIGRFTGERDNYRLVYTETQIVRLNLREIKDTVNSHSGSGNKRSSLRIRFNRDLNVKTIFEGQVGGNCYDPEGRTLQFCEYDESESDIYLPVCSKDIGDRLVRAFKHLKSLAVAKDKEDPFAADSE